MVPALLDGPVKYKFSTVRDFVAALTRAGKSRKEVKPLVDAEFGDKTFSIRQINEIIWAVKTGQLLVSCGGGRRPADGLRQQHVRTIRLLVWDTLEDFTAILTYRWDETKDDSACCTYVRGRFSEE
jgi:hypothetical protein